MDRECDGYIVESTRPEGAECHGVKARTYQLNWFQLPRTNRILDVAY
jgi:hypothetical protein